MKENKNKLIYGLYGALIGDATGVPFEFHDSSDFLKLGAENISYPYNLDTSIFKRSHTSAPLNAWSDDGSQMLALIDSCFEIKGFDLNNFAEKLKLWYQAKRYSVDNKVFDIGNQTSIALQGLMSGLSPEESGLTGNFHNGNGSLMRCLGLVFTGLFDDYKKLIYASMDSSLPTHAHLRSQVACALLNVYATLLLNNPQVKVKEAFDILNDIFTNESDREVLLEVKYIWEHRKQFKAGSPYVVDTFWSAISCVENSNNCKETIQKAILMGNDTDTTACIAGGLAGLKFDIDDFPYDWLEELPIQHDFVRIQEILLEKYPQSINLALNKVKIS